ncbi:MAG: Acetyl esterase [Anaerolineales bacterium]|nr:Acetyl esterase [Anaerolineales bacterium]
MTSKRFVLAFAVLILIACGVPPVPRMDAAPLIEDGLDTPVATLMRLPEATLRATAAPATPTLPPTKRVPPTPLNTGIAMRDVIYCTNDGIPLKMDILFPFNGYGPWPAVLYVHGGGWIGGSKLDQFGDVDVPALREGGYIAVAVSYRLAPQYPFPSMIQDVKCAVRYLRAHAAEYNLDPDHIGVRGASAGGHIAALLATADESALWDVGEYANYSSRVQAAVNMFGPADLADASLAPALSRLGPLLFGTSDLTDALLHSASPVTYVSADDAPMLLIHGDRDTLVPLKQSSLLLAALTAEGVPAELIVVQGGEHVFEPVTGDFTIPTRAQITGLMLDFFNTYLKAAN